MNIHIVDPPREIINSYIPFKVRSKFTNIIADAYQWSDILIQNTSVFKSIRGKKRLLPEIKNVAVEYFALQAVKNGNLPFDYRIGYNSNGSHPFVELYNKDLLLHFNQVPRKTSCARKAFCRDRYVKPIQSYIEFEKSEWVFDDKYYFQVNHGYQSSEPLFITLGIPSVEGKWESSIQLLEEFSAIEGHYPKSTIENVDDISFEDFQRFAEGEVEGSNVSDKTS